MKWLHAFLVGLAAAVVQAVQAYIAQPIEGLDPVAAAIAGLLVFLASKGLGALIGKLKPPAPAA